MFQLTEEKHANRDVSGRLRLLEHIQGPFVLQTAAGMAEPSPEQLADAYLMAVAPAYAIAPDQLTSLAVSFADSADESGTRIHRDQVKEVAGSTVVSYTQSHGGMPVWGSDFAVHIATNPMRVTSSSSNLHDQITLANDAPQATAASKRIANPATLAQILGVGSTGGVSRINGVRMLVYRYDPAQRTEPGTSDESVSFEPVVPDLPLPPLPPSFRAGEYYAAAEVLFDHAPPDMEELHWRALIEPVTGSVLYLRPLVAHATALVFKVDPITQTGDPSKTPAAPEADLNLCRTRVDLADLLPRSPQDLTGTLTDIREIEAPTSTEPTTSSPYAFDYTSKTTDFAAVNGYYHVNWFFNLIKGMGIDPATYFDGTAFPVSVDAWSLGGSTNVNAHCPGNASGNGIGHFCFASAQAGQTLGIGCDVRVVIHEFGHALLWDHVNSPNFGFAHSAGDALGAILMDPDSLAPDRFLTFPWPQLPTGPLDRRHDRKVADGWGWFGSRYNTQYNGEQVLSTTLFRLYRALGGDSSHRADRAWAARYVAYLIIKAIGTLTSTTTNPEVFAVALMNADLTTTNFEGHPGGAVHKVIRWAFEKQGLYQPNATPGTPSPVTQEGQPPVVDVYIDDGRKGEYPFLYSFWESQDMWVRRSPDGGGTHEDPVVGRTNYMYVRVKNRGTAAATKVSVKAYHCNPGAGLAWPDHWSPMDVPVLSAPSPIPSGGDLVLGPFAWTPAISGHECLLAIASAHGDAACDTTVNGPVAHSRFVPFDNNIGQRNVHPVRVPSVAKLPERFRKIRMDVVNPFTKTARVEMVAHLPKALRAMDYWILFSSEGGKKFTLAPNERRSVLLSLTRDPRIPPRRPWEPGRVIVKPGIPTPEDAIDEDGGTSFEDLALVRRPLRIQVVALMDGQQVGGITYAIMPEKVQIDVSPAEETSRAAPVPESAPAGEAEPGHLAETIRQQPGVRSVRVTSMKLEVEFEA